MEILLPPDELEALTSRGRAQLHEDLLRGWRVRSVLACVRQERLAKVFQDLRPLHHEALGRLVGVVDFDSYKLMREMYGETCWRDPEFRKWYFKRSPDSRVDCRSRHARFAVDGWKSGVRSQESGVSAGVCTGPRPDGRRIVA